MRTASAMGWAVLLAAGAALAQDAQAPLAGRMYVPPGIVIGSSRMVALGGAFAGVAEGASGISANLASIAHRTPTQSGRVYLSPVFTFILNRGEYDFDNDGQSDEVRRSGQYLLGLQLRVRRLGFGGFLRSNHLQFCLTDACDAPDKLEVVLSNVTLAAGYAFFDETLVASAGFVILNGSIENRFELWNYVGFGVDVGLLYRPKGSPYRIGVSVRPQMTARYRPVAGQPPAIAGRAIHEAIGAPATFSLGASFKLGEGARAYNDLPPIDYVPPSRALDPRRPFHDMFKNRDDPRNGRVLLTVQADFIAPLDEAVSIGTFIRGQPPAGVGSRWGVTPRAGVEWTAVPGRFRARVGSYLEASAFPERGARYHFTAGTELFLLRLVEDWSLTLTMDLAQRYSNFGFSIGAWR